MATSAQTKFNVGGILLDQPFKIRRLGHFGFNLVDMDAGVRFYSELLGFRISDVIDYSRRAKSPDQLAGLGDPRGYFTRYGTDHHAMVLFNKRVRDALGRGDKPGVTINQITWQVGSLRDVGEGIKWFQEKNVKIQRSGRDMPGSNWHTYLFDPDGHQNELYYGIEQVGWTGHSKPRPMYDRGFDEPPPLPQMSEFDEVQQALKKGVDVLSGYRHVDQLPATYDVDGILLPRPFKIVRIGPVSLFVADIDTAESFYRKTLGFILTEEVLWRGHRCLFLRANTEHHALALYPIALRDQLGLSPHTTCMSFGLQLANYRQLRDAVKFLRERGVRFANVPPELYPGVDYAAFALDPDGHCLMLYYYMEQVGWDGKPRPKELRRTVNYENWPEALEPASDTYQGEPFLGPWG
ncbi:MAG: extradiol dioxygenase [Deltaproteobacteria bacterium]|nr:MAG: extradiol dioxygenase [Deltaproteobacteria bacterium]